MRRRAWHSFSASGLLLRPSSVRWVGKVVIALIFAEARLRAALSKAA